MYMFYMCIWLHRCESNRHTCLCMWCICFRRLNVCLHVCVRDKYVYACYLLVFHVEMAYSTCGVNRLKRLCMIDTYVYDLFNTFKRLSTCGRIRHIRLWMLSICVTRLNSCLHVGVIDTYVYACMLCIRFTCQNVSLHVTVIDTYVYAWWTHTCMDVMYLFHMRLPHMSKPVRLVERQQHIRVYYPHIYTLIYTSTTHIYLTYTYVSITPISTQQL